MTGDWHRLALAALAAAAVAVACVSPTHAQSPAKTAAKKQPAKEADAEPAANGEEAAAKKPAKKRQDPAEAQHAIETAVRLLEAGKSEQAGQELTAVLSGGNLPPAIMAKALLYRGIAYRQQKKPAQAIADLTNALWLKGGLSEADRSDALRQRSSAYQEAGLAQGGEPITPAVPNAARSTRTASTSENPTSPESSAPPPQTSGGWTNPFAALFGGSSSPTPPAPQRPAPPATTASIQAPQPPPSFTPATGTKSSGWTRNTEVHTGSEPAGTSAAAAKPEGKFRVQVGMVRTQADAQALAARVKREHGAALAGREAEIDEATVGNMGSFYRVRMGPFASANEGQAVCSKLKGTGIDCLVVTQ